MKKIMLYVLFLSISATSFSQSTTPGPLTREDYLQKSKSQKTSAFILLGVGATVIAIAAPGNVSFEVLPILAIGGASATLGSILLFIASGRNKRKGMAITFRNTPAFQIKNSSLVHQPMPAVSIRIDL